MTQNANTPPSDPAQAAQSQNPPAQAATSTPPAGTSTSTQASSLSLEDALRELAEVRREAQGLRKRAKEQEDAAEAEKQRQREEQGQFRELAEQRKARISELEPYQTRYHALADLLKERLEAEIKDWPAEAKQAFRRAFAPDAPIEERLAAVEDARPLVETIVAQKRGSALGNSPNPQPAGQPGKREGVEELTQRYRSQRGPVL